MNIKRDFPIFRNNNDMIYLDSTASTQKPSLVIDWIKDYLENNYSNIHRGMYSISEESERLYDESKKSVCKLIWTNNINEIVYTYNSTYAANLIVWSLRRSKKLKKWDKVLISIVEHHANVVPWLILKEEIWIEIEYVKIDENYNLDFEDFISKYDSKVKVISLTHVSNITWQIFDLEKVWQLKRKDTLFIVDWSQSIPHFMIDVKKINADFLFFTWHKLLADSGIWVFWWKKELLNELKPVFSGWWSISQVTQTCFIDAKLPYKFEPGTPNLTWAISLLKALEYIDSIWWFKKVEQIENELTNYSLEKFNKRKKIKLIGTNKPQNRVAVFSFIIDGIHSNDIADYMAENNICIRSGQHCAHPLLDELGLSHTSRMSLYIYNTKDDIDRFFEILDEAIEIF